MNKWILILCASVLSACTYVVPHSINYTPSYVHHNEMTTRTIKKQACNLTLFFVTLPGDRGVETLASEVGGSVSRSRLTHLTVDEYVTLYFFRLIHKTCTRVTGHFSVVDLDEPATSPPPNAPSSAPEARPKAPEADMAPPEPSEEVIE